MVTFVYPRKNPSVEVCEGIERRSFVQIQKGCNKMTKKGMKEDVHIPNNEERIISILMRGDR